MHFLQEHAHALDELFHITIVVAVLEVVGVGDELVVDRIVGVDEEHARIVPSV